MNPRGWFLKEALSDRLTRISEPCVHRFFRGNMFHVVGRDADLVIDFGIGLACLGDALAIAPGKPVLAVATHVHVDHVGAFHEFKTRMGHRAEAPAFAAMPDGATLAHLFRAQPEALAEVPPAGVAAAEAYRIAPAALTRILDEGDVIDIGDARYRVLHLPGHSPGSIGLLDEVRGVFFSGDAIYQGQLVDDLPGCDRAAYRGTMARILDLDVDLVHGGHGTAFGQARMREIARAYLGRLTGIT